MGDLFPAYSEEEWQQRLASAVEETLRKKAGKRQERADFKRRRDYGLARRHAAKLATADPVAPQTNPGGRMPDQPPCCAGLVEGCPQHRQARSAALFQGPRVRGRGGSRVIGEPGQAKEAKEPEPEVDR